MRSRHWARYSSPAADPLVPRTPDNSAPQVWNEADCRMDSVSGTSRIDAEGYPLPGPSWLPPGQVSFTGLGGTLMNARVYRLQLNVHKSLRSRLDLSWHSELNCKCEKTERKSKCGRPVSEKVAAGETQYGGGVRMPPGGQEGRQLFEAGKHLGDLEGNGPRAVLGVGHHVLRRHVDRCVGFQRGDSRSYLFPLVSPNALWSCRHSLLQPLQARTPAAHMIQLQQHRQGLRQRPDGCSGVREGGRVPWHS